MKRTIKILVVDDQEENLELIKTWLEAKRDEYRILTAATPEDALAIAERELIHLAIIDVILSDDPEDRRGFDLARKIWSGIPKVFLTVLTDITSSRTGLRKEMREEANIVDYIPRSLGNSEQELLKVISDVVNKLNLGLEIDWGSFSPVMLVEMLKGFKRNEDHEKKAIAEELENLFCQGFGDANSISILELKRGKGGCAVAHVAPTLADGEGADVMVKFGPRGTILREFQNYQNFVKGRVPFDSTVVTDDPAQTPHLAAIKYSFVGGSAIMGSFESFFASSPPDKIAELLDHLFEETCKKWYDARRKPNDAQDIPLDQLYRDAQSLNLAEDKHVGLLETRINQLMSFGPLATNIKADGPSHVRVDLGAISERLPNPLVLALRERWDNGSHSTVFRPPSLMAITHGDLNGDNILVSKGNKGFLIDFYKTGFSPIFRDFVVLESVIKFEFIHKLNLAQRYRLEKELLAPGNLLDPISLSTDLEQNSEVQKVVVAVGRLRQLAAQVSLSNDAYEYYVGLLFYALKETLGFSSGSETHCCDDRQFHAFLSAAIVAEKLLSKQNKTKDTASAVKLFLNYASEDLNAVSDIYERMVAEGFNPWMSDRDIIGGEQWEHSIKTALRDAHLFIPILTKNAVRKRGFRQKEINWARDLSLEKMTSDIHIIPVRLHPDCEIPEDMEHLQCIDLYDARGWERLFHAIREGLKRLEH